MPDEWLWSRGGVPSLGADVHGINAGKAVTPLLGVVTYAGTGTGSPC